MNRFRAIKRFNSQQEAIKHVNKIVESSGEDPLDFDIDSFVDYYLLQSVNGELVYQMEYNAEMAEAFLSIFSEFSLV